ncbi:hypothetical protein SAMN04488074_13622 [Lentzea albidocapillata subsp. violacea]|uniref:Uncharacterized protein n=1 Tax=Lentzea albidocapillata subsp. violacea TaxID=128104 RepID=A0A1G9YXQ0_9PSEU|nr:hypothetical protein [Lentzea albidocapillata]SDN13898.1 hypothetical protein SAMN04488074_13622 [Lentzea albidocapillata subsp. violacea]
MSQVVKSQAEMQTHLAAGEAVALFPEGVPGPVTLRGRWWIVADGQQHYQLADEDQAVMLTRQAERLAAATDAARQAANRAPRSGS